MNIYLLIWCLRQRKGVDGSIKKVQCDSIEQEKKCINSCTPACCRAMKLQFWAHNCLILKSL